VLPDDGTQRGGEAVTILQATCFEIRIIQTPRRMSSFPARIWLEPLPRIPSFLAGNYFIRLADPGR